MTNSQQAVLNSPLAMEIILTEAKKVIAAKAGTTVEMVNYAIAAKNENVLTMMRKLTTEGIEAAAAI